MISSEEYGKTNSNTPIVSEVSTLLETSDTHTVTVLEQENIPLPGLSKTVPDCTEQSENIVETGENLNNTILDTKDLVYNVPVTTESSAILSLNQNDALNPNDGQIVPAIRENNDNFEPQSVLATSGNSLLDEFHIDAAQKDELTPENMCSSALEGRETQIDEAVSQSEDLLPQDLGDLPPWAARLKGCERIGDSYRGYVHTEAELDILLSMHKEHTHSSWGTRQSPSSQKPSVRFMWKSQYVPYDGIPFLNSGRRATVMECQYGPRRKGNKVKVEYNENGHPVKRAHRPTCPARIYVKRVRKFPEYKIDKNFEGTPGLRLAQERALTALRVACLESRGEERFYIQFPLEIAHEYHHDDDEMMPHQPLSLLPTQVNLGSSRLDPRVVEMINELVARGVTDIYQVKHGVINFVEKDLFLGSDEEHPARHNKLFYPTITDIQNHIHQAQLALESGTLECLPPPETPPKSPDKDDRSRKRKRSEPRRVRGSKSTPLRTICIRTDDSLELARDHSLQDAQGQVYVMVPSASGLFANSESLIGASLDGEKTSLVQVVTVPATNSSAFLGQQGNGTLDLTGQFLALPVVNCDNQIPTSEDSAIGPIEMHGQDSFGKEPISVGPSTMEHSLNKNEEVHQTIVDHIQTPNNQIPPPSVTMSIPPDTITMATPIPPATITMATPIPPATITMATPISPSAVTMATPDSAETVPLKTNTSIVPSQNIAMVDNTMVISTNSTVIPDLSITSSNMSMTSSMVPMTSPDALMTSSNLSVNSVVPISSNMPMTPYTSVTSSVNMTSPDMTSPSSTVPMTSLDILISQGFTMSYPPMTSPTVLMTSPDNQISSKTSDNFATSVADIQQSTAAVAPGYTNRSPPIINQINSPIKDATKTTPGINELFDEVRKSSNGSMPNINSSYDTSMETIKTHATSPFNLSGPT